MPEVRIVAEPREEFGKGAARRTRRAGKVPAVIYGHGAEPRHISLPARDFEHALKTDAGMNVLLSVQVGGADELALPKAIQRDPLRGDIEHVDLITVRRGERVTVDVAVVVQGDVVPGGLLDQQMTTISLEAEATHIPQHLDVDIAGLEIGESIHASDLPLPEGATLKTPDDALVVHISAAPTAEELEAELAAAEEELGAGQAGMAEQEAAKAEVVGEAAASDRATGEGDIVADTESGEGGPSAEQTPQ